MKKLSGFDLGMIIAFAVVTLLGAAAWWYLSGQLQTAQDDVKSADDAFNRFSVAKGGTETIIVTPANGKILQTNIDLIKSELDPLIKTKLLQKDNKLASVTGEDPVAWKHDLDDYVQRLTTDAKAHSVALPPNFYFGFSRYLSQNPGDEQTTVLSKQLIGMDQIATILINAPVKGIQAIRRSYEEDPHGSSSDPDRLSGLALDAPGGTYTAYPFEFDFETTTENLRTIIDKLIQSPYVLVTRTLVVQSKITTAPGPADLDRMAAIDPSSSVVNSSPGEVAATTSTKGPQYLFGSATINVKIRVDMIDWHVASADAAANPKTP